MKKKDLDEIARIEKAIKERYGEEAIINPRSLWDKEKEERYLKDLKEFHTRKEASRNKITEESEGFIVNTKKTKNETGRTCPVCSSYSFVGIDDLFMTKFECCFNCYIQYIEGREERWKSGWRPNN